MSKKFWQILIWQLSKLPNFPAIQYMLHETLKAIVTDSTMTGTSPYIYITVMKSMHILALSLGKIDAKKNKLN